MTYSYSPCMITADDRRRITAMVEKLKDAIDDLMVLRAVTQDLYLPTLKGEIALDDAHTEIRKLKDADPTEHLAP